MTMLQDQKSTADHLLRLGNVPTFSDGSVMSWSALMISILSAKYCAAFELHMELVPDHRLLEFADYPHQFSLSSPSSSSLVKKKSAMSHWTGDGLS